ncbi:MAG: tRNA (N6-threonylcarbamoyladenosine(37)-N6)-methyltransferase TrmO [Desulfobacterales bacterium]|nr:tRNA (N6-threonylcarbamoyladenosine(37)-N6)-methyltransferase TrmO [Deltaproteobacteria bacterium]MBT8373981.1 tRNA (N6-threonylcarbamoyladenosine(37)-N6)-methyltransferase TrmO [Deltaproteobacteria bacterium]NNK85349.1 tRNA (N6-threonylcarbamoyladenosine(37)-N6)-methyltransferase TrmO [Desulfobacterales bacterium]NNL41893.1 tRNA (N6-threonylcarbamoyladenosine(37)-N6)-methyltransferase TrmO [Desulfobacterales bacterium]
MKNIFKIFPVGFIRKKDDTVFIEIDKKYNAALLGLEQFSHINVLYWFHENDTPENRSTLQVYPCKNKKNPLTGVFATHSPLRPNLIAMSLCKILSINETSIKIDKIDAFHGSPVIDIKCFFPAKLSIPDVIVPNWERKQD